MVAIALLTFTNSWAQEMETAIAAAIPEATEVVESRRESGVAFAADFPRASFTYAELTGDGGSDAGAAAGPERFKYLDPEAFKRLPDERIDSCCGGADAKGPGVDDDKTDAEAARPRDKFHWKPAIAQSLVFLAFQHSVRAGLQEKTRRELGGPFFRDWGRSVAGLRGWKDGDNFLTNYIAHPMQGAFTGRIFVNNSDRARRAKFGSSKTYWESRMKALAWSAFWSTQFELGPISEATIGNVGMKKGLGYSEMSYGDLVVTPVAGTALLVGEDAIDKYILENWLEKRSSRLKIKVLRSFLTPTTSIANMLRGKVPWKRDYRPLSEIEVHRITPIREGN